MPSGLEVFNNCVYPLSRIGSAAGGTSHLPRKKMVWGREKSETSLCLWLLLVYFVTPTVLAHDFWIEPAHFQAAPGAAIAVRLLVGEHFSGKPFPRDPSHFKQFAAHGPHGPVPIMGRPGMEPAGYLRAGNPGFYVIGYRSNRRSITLESQKFEDYLLEEGLEDISAFRAQQQPNPPQVKEIYSRCAKALVKVGEIESSTGDGGLGFTLELIAEKNPYLLLPGSQLPVRLVYEGKSLKGAQVVAFNRDDPGKKLSFRSDQEGRVVLLLERSGVWLVKVVHMVAAPEDTGADWESFWASLTFELPKAR